MSTEFSLQRISAQLMRAFEQDGTIALDILLAASDFEDIYNANDVNHYFSSEGVNIGLIPSDLVLSILEEGLDLMESEEKVLSFDGSYIECINFFLTGEKQFNSVDFLVKKLPSTDITLVNALVGTRHLKEELGLCATYFTTVDIIKMIDPLHTVARDNPASRWLKLQKIWNKSAHKERLYSERVNARSHLSFNCFFPEPNEPVSFIQDQLLAVMNGAVGCNQGLLAMRRY